MVTKSILPFLSILFCFIACSEATNADRFQLTASDVQVQQEDTAGLPSGVFAGGCFWCTEAYFERLQGVKAVISGYSGGSQKEPTYKQVSAGKTDHAEAVQVYYDPQQITYQELVEVFFATHDPTTLNRQGPDYGKQYRSIVFYKNAKEKKLVEDYIGHLNEAGTYKNKIVTYVQPFKEFWPAEEYHQDYYRRNPQDPYVMSVAKPKVRKFEDNYRDKLKPEYIK
ncbi:peptide-methionine (S)-S-oxide reductase MsrA [Pontibacter anaerobius]|uniref:Peptide methionine sulfoxide reductase MsrA n=1 Tax=Pontibacter anaerobius TaxID=2993940 RepID=A0ABT3RBQ7_9BACT|nr:peptide-methionine (S)-S-oxide reductase MsrA [Pontibacter anaerobius]MCX2739292.1 peptide-methionine (S)-S-oxide reductase MsrA [Pontibacter anaerobius]